MTISINIYSMRIKGDVLYKAEFVRGMLVAHRESTRLIWSPDVQHCNYFTEFYRMDFSL